VLKETFTWIPTDRHRAGDFIDAARHEDVFVAVEGSVILGVLSLYAPSAFVHSLYVEDRGRGIGKALLDHVDRLVDKPLTLKVQAANRRALAFYQREGFDVIDEGRDPPFDVMWLLMER
jgi:ribosomal protein S18 acetylase RimI-like enzyme